MITITNLDKSKGIKFPEDINEIKVGDLQTLISNINTPPHYAVIALTFKTTLMNVSLTMNHKDATPADVVPILVKIDEVDNLDYNYTLGHNVISSRTEIERAIHLPVTTAISYEEVVKFINENREVLKDMELINKDIVLVSFKLMPITSIYGVKDSNANIVDPYNV